MLKKALLCAVCAISSFNVFAQPTVPEFKNIGIDPKPPIGTLVNITEDGYVIGSTWFEYCTQVTCFNDGEVLTVRDSNMNHVLSLTFQREILQHEKSIMNIESAIIDGDNNLILAGTFMSDMNFAPNDAVSVNRHGGAASGMWSGFLAKYRLSDGHLFWVNTMDASGVASVGGASLATDDKKNIFLYLAKGGNVDIDPGPASVIVNKGVLAKYNTNGDYLAHIAAEQSYGGIYTPFKMIDKKLYLLSIADSVYPNKQTFVFQEYDPENMTVTRSKKIGAFKRSPNWPGYMHVKYTPDKSGNIWLLSSYTESCSIGAYNKTLVTVQNGTEKEQLLIKLDNNLDVANVWPVHKTINSATYAANFGIDSLGNVLIIGTVRDSIDIDLSAGTQFLKTVFPPPYLSGNWGTMYFNCYDKNMNLLWSKTLGDTSRLWAYNIEFGHRKNIYILGQARGTINFDLIGSNFTTTPPSSQPMGLTEMYARYKWNTATYTTDVPRQREQRAQISLYPNPVNSVLNVDLGKTSGKQARLTVTDINGRTVWSGAQRGSETVQVPTGTLPPAAYLLSIDIDGYPKETRQFVKQ